MPDEGLLIGIAQLAAVIAGFTAVTATLTPAEGSWTEASRIRQRAIVSTSMNVMFEALVPVIAAGLIADVRTAIVVSSGLVFLYVLWVVAERFRQFRRAGALRQRNLQFMMTLSFTSVFLFGADAVAFGSTAVYALALCFQMAVAVLSFYTLVASAS
jgi:hypothetical protein